MFDDDKYYRHSGVIGLTGPINMTVFGTIAALVLGTVYGYAIRYIPFIYINLFITLGFGAGVGYFVGLGAKIGKVRNTKALLVFGFIFGCFAEYVGWVSWIFATSEQQRLALMPSEIFAVLQFLAEEGAWDIFGWTPKGLALYSIWTIEAIMIIGMSAGVAWFKLTSIPFCEECEKWIEEKHTIGPLDNITNHDELKEQLERSDYTMLNSLKKQEPVSDAYLQIDLVHCPDCNQNHYLTVKSIVTTTDSDKKEKTDVDNIIENLIITPDQHNTIKEQYMHTTETQPQVN
ncbi:MAG: MptD family putative ECF transporter S component [Planctomycetes bacterium]|nr:MptD family putative ECF transporter S component [Planctomycetota bacterium]